MHADPAWVDFWRESQGVKNLRREGRGVVVVQLEGCNIEEPRHGIKPWLSGGGVLEPSPEVYVSLSIYI